jgi:hypothetical protein
VVSIRHGHLRHKLVALNGSNEPLSLRDAEALKSAWAMTSGAEPALLVEIAQRAAAAEGPVLECGSGLTTLVAAVYARHGVWALENHGPYGRGVARSLARAGLDHGHVLHAPLVSYGDFDWYTVPDRLPDQPFALVICDGPPSETRGGRIGLLPVARDRLAPGATVLLDDSERPGEQEILALWQHRYGVDVQQAAGSRHAIVTMPRLGST